MEKQKENSCISEAMGAYFKTACASCEAYGNGHINDTYLVVHNEKRYILQKMNTSVFTKPVELMENIIGVTEFIKNELSKNGGDTERETLTVLPTLDGKKYYIDSHGGYWRLYKFIEDSITFEKVEKPRDFYLCAVAFGNFQNLLADYPVKKLHCTVENLHNTPWRYEKLLEAEKNDAAGRAALVRAELEFVKARKELAYVLERAHEDGVLPLRVTHNDTKLNNILFDRESSKPVCVIDLDTVMPGYSVTDFGDSVRFGANTASEDEKDLSLVGLDLDLFAEYTRGFVEGCKGSLKKEEIMLLPYGALVITFELGMRFLTDYLNGDVYFKTHRKDHNLDRARCQFALLRDMEKKLDTMAGIAAEYAQ